MPLEDERDGRDVSGSILGRPWSARIISMSRGSIPPRVSRSDLRDVGRTMFEAGAFGEATGDGDGEWTASCAAESGAESRLSRVGGFPMAVNWKVERGLVLGGAPAMPAGRQETPMYARQDEAEIG